MGIRHIFKSRVKKIGDKSEVNDVNDCRNEDKFRSLVRIGSLSVCLLGQFNRILWISYSEAGQKNREV